MAYLAGLLGQFGPVLVLGWVLIGQAGFPLPAYPLLVVAGSLAATERMSLGLIFPAALLGCLVADLGWYFAGRRYGPRVIRLLCRLSLTPDTCVVRTQSVFDRWGPQSLVVAKFVPGFAAVATVLAGANKVSRLSFLVYDAFGAALWSGVALALGWVFARAVETVLDELQNFGRNSIVLLATVMLLYVLVKAWKRMQFRRTLQMPRLSVSELSRLPRERVMLIDVRHRDLWKLEHIPGSVPLDLANWEGVGQEGSSSTAIVVYCDCPDEASAVVAASVLREKGLQKVFPLQGGLDGWRRAGFPTQGSSVHA